MRKQSRVPEIVADAAYVIINQPSTKFSGNFCIDDQVLAHQGLHNLDRYAATPGSTEFQEGSGFESLKFSPVRLCRRLH
jgi:citronellol/citronellal dehydrogenase